MDRQEQARQENMDMILGSMRRMPANTHTGRHHYLVFNADMADFLVGKLRGDGFAVELKVGRDGDRWLTTYEIMVTPNPELLNLLLLAAL